MIPQLHNATATILFCKDLVPKSRLCFRNGMYYGNTMVYSGKSLAVGLPCKYHGTWICHLMHHCAMALPQHCRLVLNILGIYNTSINFDVWIEYNALQNHSTLTSNHLTHANFIWQTDRPAKPEESLKASRVRDVTAPRQHLAEILLRENRSIGTSTRDVFILELRVSNLN